MRKRILPVFLLWCFRGGCVLGLAGAARSEAESAPAIGVRCAITVPVFRENLEAQCPGIEREVATFLARLAGEQFPYLQWVALSNAPATNDPAFILSASLVAAGSGTIPAAQLTFAWQERGGKRECLPPVTVYDEAEMFMVTHRPEALRDRVTQKLQEHLGKEPHQKLLQERSLVRVPVMRSLVVGEQEQRFFMPIPWERLLAHETSRLRVEYFSKRSPTNAVPVVLGLAPTDNWGDRVGCSVYYFNYPPPPPRGNLQTGSLLPWDDAMAESLRNARLETVRVFMVHYVQDFAHSTTTDGLVLPSFAGTGGRGQP